MAVFLLPLGVLFFAENVIFDRNQFTYRQWEAHSTHLFSQFFPGAFYPDQDYARWENGDQRRSGPPVRETHWVTDHYGQRNLALPDKGEHYGIVVGDSNTIGSSLDQDQMLASRLEALTSMPHVTLGFEYWSPDTHPLVREVGPPDHVILELKRGYLVILNSSMEVLYHRFDPRRTDPNPLLIKLDHATKFCLLNRLRGEVGSQALNIQDQFTSPHMKYPRDWIGKSLSRTCCEQRVKLESMQQAIANAPDLNPGVAAVTWLARRCEAQGIRFIVVVLPDEYRVADEAVVQLQKQGVEVIGFMPTEEQPKGADLKWFWQPHDSHWTPEAVDYCAGLLAERLTDTPSRMFTHQTPSPTPSK